MQLSIKVKNALFTLLILIWSVLGVAIFIECLTAKLAHTNPDSAFCAYCMVVIAVATAIISPFTAIKKWVNILKMQ